MTDNPIKEISLDDPIQKAGRTGVYTLFREQALRNPDKTSVVSQGRQLTYGELLDRVDRIAAMLQEMGVDHGKRIAFLSENRIEYIEVQLAAAKNGSIVACQNWRLQAPELQHCIDLVTPSLIIYSPRQAEALNKLQCREVPCLSLGDDYESALANSNETASNVQVHPESGLIILYTSGTTGPAKAATISQRALIWRMLLLRFDLSIDPEDGYLAWSPMFHMGGTEHSLSTLMMGGIVIVTDGFNPDETVEILANYKLGWLLLVPATVDRLVAALKKRPIEVKGVKLVGSMADLLPKALISELTTQLRAPFFNSFGSTETGLPPASGHLIPPGVEPDNLSKKLSSFCSVRLVDGSGTEVPTGSTGEAFVRGPTLFSGYWGAPEINERDFPGGWFRMGDLFRKNPDGSFDFVGRSKYLIKTGGENVYPAEIENILLSDKRIADAVVVRKPDTRWGEVPVAVVSKATGSLCAEDVLELTRVHLAGYKQPKEIHFVDFETLPRSDTGKIKREDLEEWLQQNKWA